MDVVYKSDGKSDIQLSIRLPYFGENPEYVINLFAPFDAWKDTTVSYITPDVGTTGTVTALLPTVSIPPAPTTNVISTATVNVDSLKAMVYQVLEEIKSTQV
jgi:hypothetical protein